MSNVCKSLALFRSIEFITHCDTVVSGWFLVFIGGWGGYSQKFPIIFQKVFYYCPLALFFFYKSGTFKMVYALNI